MIDAFYSVDLFDTAMETFHDVAVGGIIGVAASYIAAKVLRKDDNAAHRPAVDVSREVIECTSIYNTTAIMVKLVNRTDKALADVKITLEALTPLISSQSHGKRLDDVCKLTYRELEYIPEFDFADKEAKYAQRVKLYLSDGDVIAKIKKAPIFRITVVAKCPYYNTFDVFHQEYKADEILDKTFIFNYGDDLSAQKNNN